MFATNQLFSWFVGVLGNDIFIPFVIVDVFIPVFYTSFSFGGEGEIHDAIRQGDLSRVKEFLLKRPELIDAKNDNGWTPLHLSSLRGHKDVVHLLIKNGAEVNVKNNKGQTPLDNATKIGH